MKIIQNAPLAHHRPQMRKRTFFIRLAVVALSIALFSHTFAGLRQVQRKSKFFQDLKSIVSEGFKSSGTEYAFFIKKLGFSGLKLMHEEAKQFPAASLIKLPILAAAFYAIGEKKVSLEEIVVIKKRDVAGGSGKLKALSLPRKLTFGQLLELMISSSDNTATNKVIEILNFKYINSIFKRLGLTDTTLARKMMDFSQRKNGIENYTSAADISYLLEKIYRGRLVNQRLSKLALIFLKKQKVNDRLPRYLPAEAVIAHKTGLERGVVHDAGIVFSPKGNYLICVLVKGVKSAKAKKFIAQLSLLAYNLINKF